MIQIRRGVFETNSSSTHSMSICTSEEYRRFIEGILVYDSYTERLIDNTEAKRRLVDIKYKFDDDCRYMSYDDFLNQDDEQYEHYFNIDGKEMVAFGSYSWG